MDYFRLIKQRMSTRDFTDQPVQQEQLDAFRRYFVRSMQLDAGIGVSLVFAQPNPEKLAGAAGYQGFAIAAPQYLVLMTDPAAHAAENAGFIGADLLLRLTEMGLDHCWITFHDGDAVKKALDVTSAQQVAALIAFGHGKRESKKVRLDIKSPSDVGVVRREGRKAPKIGIDELVYNGAWGDIKYVSEMNDENDLKTAFIAASLAPSYLNRQPYRLIYEPGIIVLVQLADALTDAYDARLGAGIVMHHISAVLSQSRAQAPAWTVSAPEKDYHLPPGCKAVAYCKA